jgi:hypothetical protein
MKLIKPEKEKRKGKIQDSVSKFSPALTTEGYKIKERGEMRKLAVLNC